MFRRQPVLLIYFSTNHAAIELDFLYAALFRAYSMIDKMY